MDHRHQKRIKIVQNLYAHTFHRLKTDILPFPQISKTYEIIKKTSKIDSLINRYAKKFKAEKIAKIDLAILRWAIYEFEQKELPPKVIIDEAIELAKELGAERSYAFINAILGKVLTEYAKKQT